MDPIRKRRAVPTWFWVAFATWLFVYSPTAIYVLPGYGLNWFVVFAIVIIPLWFIVRLWIHQTSKSRRD